ncbi:MAG: AMP-binding protein [Verrucomicrobiota bacterium]
MERAELKQRLVRAVEQAVGASQVIEAGQEIFVVAPEQVDDVRARIGDVPPASAGELGWLLVASGGTSGRLKFARHDEETVGAAVRGFCAHFGLSRVNAVSVLPLHHVSGLMAWMRCTLTGGEYVAWDWKRLEGGERPPVDAGEGDWVISLVPTQLQRLLGQPAAVEWLRGFRVIFVGGGPVWPQLADTAAAARLPIALSYGMTETAAMVTALRPEEFLAGARSSGTALPHARVQIDAEGRVRVGGASLFRGYYPERVDEREFLTGDLGRLDERGQLHVLGRADAMIITGGKKVQPEEVEAALRASGEFAEVVVLGVPDAEWGESVVACYPRAAGCEPDLARAVAEMAPWKRPKRFVAVEVWPRNAQGKVNRAALRAAVT